jgi:hypothetical protein
VMVTVLRPLSTSELLDSTFHLYRDNFWLFVGITAIPQFLVLILQLGNVAMLASRFFLAAGVTTVSIWLASLIAVEISHAGIVVAVSDLHLDRVTNIASAYKTARPSLLRVIFISFVVILLPALIAFLAIVLVAAIAIPLTMATHAVGGFENLTFVRIASGIAALVAFILVPVIALRWWLAWAVAIPVTVLEGGGLRTSLRRSKSLTKGSRGRIFLICLLMIVLTWVVSALIQTPIFIFVGLRSLQQPTNIGPVGQAIASAGGFLSASLVGPLLTIALTLIYYDQRVRKEGFDLQLMMASLEPSSQAPAAAATATTT